MPRARAGRPAGNAGFGTGSGTVEAATFVRRTPPFRLTLSAKIAAVGFGAYGLLFHALLIGVLMGRVAMTDIGPYVMSMAGLLLVPVISMAIYFRKAMASGAGE